MSLSVSTTYDELVLRRVMEDGMKNNRRRIGVLTALTGGVMALGSLVVGPGSAGATNTNVNVTTCSQVGAPNAMQFNGQKTSGNYTAKDGANHKLFDYKIKDDKKVTISNVSSSITIVKVVVKGGNGYNTYNTPVVDMKAPNNGGNNVPDISHWFACYTTNQTTTTTAKPTTTTAKPTTTTSDDDECDDQGYDRSSNDRDDECDDECDDEGYDRSSNDRDDECDDECDDEGYGTESKQHHDDDCDDDHATTTTVKATTTTAQETTTTEEETTTTEEETTTTEEETTTTEEETTTTEDEETTTTEDDEETTTSQGEETTTTVESEGPPPTEKETTTTAKVQESSSSVAGDGGTTTSVASGGPLPTTGSGTGTGGGSLPQTGSDQQMILLLGGLALVSAGMLMIALTRRPAEA